MMVALVCKPTGCSQSCEDVGQLTHRRIGEDPFDIIGDEGDECGHTGCDSTNPSDEHREIGEVALLTQAEEVELANGIFYPYKGNYTQYLEKKAAYEAKQAAK